MAAKVGGNRESGRLKDGNQKRILDEASRKRRARKALEALEQDNFHDDPHADLVMSKKLPKFQDNLESKATRRKKARNAEYYKQKYRKTFGQLVEEERAYMEDGVPNYVIAEAPPTELPERNFCAVCGFVSNYTCVSCGARYCSVRCLGTHLDTRCLKWTA